VDKPAIPNVYAFAKEGTGPKFNAAFAAGCGAPIIHDGKLRPGPIALWGDHKFWPTLKSAIDEGRTWYYGDHAYFGRGQFFRITRNALQAHGGFYDGGPRFESNLARFEFVSKLVPIQIEPAKPTGEFILVCPPSEALSERSGFKQQQWTDRVLRRLQRITKRAIVVRQKPRINRTPAPLLEAMKGAYCLVTYTSNAAIEAVCAGYPAICTGPNPVNVFGGSFDNFARLYVAPQDSRRAWAAELCANQWTLAEIEAGVAWKAIGK
jgi:hypothetical protein